MVNLRGQGRCSRAVERNLSRVSTARALRRMASGRWSAALFPWVGVALDVIVASGEDACCHDNIRLAPIEGHCYCR